MQASSVVKVPSGAGRTSGRAVAVGERCSFVKITTRRTGVWTIWSPSLDQGGEGPAKSFDSWTTLGTIGVRTRAGQEALADKSGDLLSRVEPLAISNETGGAAQKLGGGHRKR